MGVFEAVALLAGLAGLYLWNLSRAASNLIYLPGSITGFNLLPPIVYLEILIQNTSNVDFTINSMAANVTCDGTLVGNVSEFVPILIPANSQGAIPITLTFMPLGLVNEIIEIISGSANGFKNIEIKGSVNANGIQQAFLIPYKIGS